MRLLPLLAALLILSPQLHADSNCNIRMAGDSTMQDVDPRRNPDFGWGQLLPELTKKHTHIFNHAKGGRSTRTFLLENRWRDLINDTKPGDWILIQFGHNDAAFEKPERYTAPADYEANLRGFVADVRDKRAHPVLITPVIRRHFDDEGKLRDVHGIYPSLVRKVSADLDVPLIDLFELSSAHILDSGLLESIKLFVHIGPDTHPCCPEGRIDNTHFTQRGAREIAALVVDDIQQSGPTELGACFVSNAKNKVGIE